MQVTQHHHQVHKPTLCERYKALPKGKKVLLTVFVIWVAQAIPKWSAAILADGEASAAIISFFITPKF